MTKKRRRRRNRRLQLLLRCSTFLVCVAFVIAGIVIYKKVEAKKAAEAAYQAMMESAYQAEVANGGAKKLEYSGSNAGEGWNSDSSGRWYLNKDNTYFADGWREIDGNVYYFGKDGYALTGWQIINGEDHYFDENGAADPTAKRKLVALTYDDGPSKYTDRLLDCLEENNAKATFFVVGTQIELYPDILKRADDMGMEIGSHTYSHKYLYKESSDSIQEEMQKNEELINSLLGHGTKIMRPTGGGINDTVEATIDMPMICWDLDTLDWDTRDVDSTVEKTLRNVQDGTIVLMHDLYEPTVAASEIIIPELISRGYKLVTVSELAKARGVTLENGVAYYDFYAKSDTQE